MSIELEHLDDPRRAETLVRTDLAYRFRDGSFMRSRYLGDAGETVVDSYSDDTLRASFSFIGRDGMKSDRKVCACSPDENELEGLVAEMTRHIAPVHVVRWDSDRAAPGTGPGHPRER